MASWLELKTSSFQQLSTDIPREQPAAFHSVMFQIKWEITAIPLDKKEKILKINKEP